MRKVISILFVTTAVLGLLILWTLIPVFLLGQVSHPLNALNLCPVPLSAGSGPDLLHYEVSGVLILVLAGYALFSGFCLLALYVLKGHARFVKEDQMRTDLSDFIGISALH